MSIQRLVHKIVTEALFIIAKHRKQPKSPQQVTERKDLCGLKPVSKGTLVELVLNKWPGPDHTRWGLRLSHGSYWRTGSWGVAKAIFCRQNVLDCATSRSLPWQNQFPLMLLFFFFPISTPTQWMNIEQLEKPINFFKWHLWSIYYESLPALSHVSGGSDSSLLVLRLRGRASPWLACLYSISLGVHVNRGSGFYYLPFPDEETEAQRSSRTYVKSHSQ